MNIVEFINIMTQTWVRYGSSLGVLQRSQVGTTLLTDAGLNPGCYSKHLLWYTFWGGEGSISYFATFPIQALISELCPQMVRLGLFSNHPMPRPGFEPTSVELHWPVWDLWRTLYQLSNCAAACSISWFSSEHCAWKFIRKKLETLSFEPRAVGWEA